MTTITGTPDGDLLTGSDEDDVIYGLDGNDIIDGGFGADQIFAGKGSDQISFSSVAITFPRPTKQGLLDGGEGLDVIFANLINPVTLGTIQNSSGKYVAGIYVGNQIFELRDIEAIYLGSGNNSFTLHAIGPGTVYTGGGDDNGSMDTTGSLFLNEGDDSVFLTAYFTDRGKLGFLAGGEGQDTLKFNNGFEVDIAFHTADANGVRYAFYDFERYEGMAQNGQATRISGSDAGETILVNNLFNDGSVGVTFDGRGGDDDLTGSLGDDGLIGGAGDDILRGDKGSDALDGGAGHDKLFGGDGDDLLEGRVGFNVVDGGEGTDTVVVSSGPSSTWYLSDNSKNFLVANGETTEIANIETVRFGDGLTLSASAAASSLKTFDGASYIASYADLRASLGSDAQAGLDHFLNFGAYEGRTVIFDAWSYLAANADLIRAFGADASKAAAHYLQFGIAEGRSVAFDGYSYLAANADLRTAFGADTYAAAKHYVTFSATELRSTTFDGLSYIASYGDLIGAFGMDASQGTKHFVDVGASEGRVTLFDALNYGASYVDLARAFGSDTDGLTRHYIQNGFSEGRSPDTGFDEVAYLLSNPDLGRSSFGAKGALEHWVSSGAAEGRMGDSLYGREQVDHKLVAGTDIKGKFDFNDDHDWYSFQLQAGQQVQFDFLSDGEADLTIHRADGSLVGSYSTVGDGPIAFVTEVGGFYYIGFDPIDQFAGNYTFDYHLL